MNMCCVRSLGESEKFEVRYERKDILSLKIFRGGRLVYQSTKKRSSGPKCAVTGKGIQGAWLLALVILPASFQLCFSNCFEATCPTLMHVSILSPLSEKLLCLLQLSAL
ncbi:60S ribosomal protein L34 [Camellia lanceoleosa]|uniref:60S ribosomal protein L34 n=1 Tax=Camellia lanceoleosa TaxID=1840588 RepID=A0ACC0HPA2_9ERIC|nr:60S ribosomal protein L34 [Camellia lanceoleosa]